MYLDLKLEGFEVLNCFIQHGGFVNLQKDDSPVATSLPNAFGFKWRIIRKYKYDRNGLPCLVAVGDELLQGAHFFIDPVPSPLQVCCITMQSVQLQLELGSQE